jgi:hypothetical protein
MSRSSRREASRAAWAFRLSSASWATLLDYEIDSSIDRCFVLACTKVRRTKQGATACSFKNCAGLGRAARWQWLSQAIGVFGLSRHEAVAVNRGAVGRADRGVERIGVHIADFAIVRAERADRGRRQRERAFGASDVGVRIALLNVGWFGGWRVNRR